MCVGTVLCAEMVVWVFTMINGSAATRNEKNCKIARTMNEYFILFGSIREEIVGVCLKKSGLEKDD